MRYCQTIHTFFSVFIKLIYLCFPLFVIDLKHNQVIREVMQYAEFKRQLGKANLSVHAFAELLGKHPNSITNRAHKEVPQHLAVIATLIAEMAEHGLDFRGALTKIKTVPMKPRGGFSKKSSATNAGSES